jgi:glutamate-5-semialdehyde dehydrogenase
MTDIANYMQHVGQNARQASATLRTATTKVKNHALECIKQALIAHKADILIANAQDLANGQQVGLESSLLDRLQISEKVFDGIISSLNDVIALPDPIGEISDMTYRPSGIQLGKMRVPLGVVGMIYESRPNVTIEAGSLAIKSGNAIILRGGKEAFYSNQALAKCVHLGLEQAGLSPNCVQVLNTTDRSAVDFLITMTQFVDVIVPRGGRGLIERISNNARVPVIKHLDGNCHTFIDDSADMDMASRIVVNAKTSRYGTCNTMETLLVHQKIADTALPRLLGAIKEADDEMSFRLCSASWDMLADKVESLSLSLATEDDWYAEYLAPILAVKVVADISQAVAHINHYGSHHTDVIITNDYAHSNYFLQAVDSSSVMVNASSRFADGFEYGLGAEIGISTDKIHARGPVGLHGLTSQKWVVLGHGEIR